MHSLGDSIRLKETTSDKSQGDQVQKMKVRGKFKDSIVSKHLKGKNRPRGGNSRWFILTKRSSIRAKGLPNVDDPRMEGSAGEVRIL